MPTPTQKRRFRQRGSPENRKLKQDRRRMKRPKKNRGRGRSGRTRLTKGDLELFAAQGFEFAECRSRVRIQDHLRIDFSREKKKDF